MVLQAVKVTFKCLCLVIGVTLLIACGGSGGSDSGSDDIATT